MCWFSIPYSKLFVGKSENFDKDTNKLRFYKFSKILLQLFIFTERRKEVKIV